MTAQSAGPKNGITTIIDILRKGNQELFHSNMIAWLLDPRAEHGLGKTCLEEFADKLAARGRTELRDAIRKSLPDSVHTESTSYRSRYDIVIRIGQMLIVIENKTKSVGSRLQFNKYEANSTVLVGLGLCDVSFLEDVASHYPILTYKDILDILTNIPIQRDNDFSVLIKHYRIFLERELSVLDLIADCYANGRLKLHKKIPKILLPVGSYTKNDRRFLNLYLLKKFEEHLSKSRLWHGAKWETDKNMQSGVWLANYEAMPISYSFTPSIECLCRENTGRLWFHIELWDGVFATELDDCVGMLQLRCSTDKNNEDFIKQFKGIYQCGKQEYYSSRIMKGADTFYVVGSNLSKKELVFEQLVKRLTRFARKFGNFGIQGSGG